MAIPQKNQLSILSAPSILGLRPSGVEKLAQTLLDNSLAAKLGTSKPIIQVPDLNNEYDPLRSRPDSILNESLLAKFSNELYGVVRSQLEDETFPLVLGGDCSILLGCMAAARSTGKNGLFFIDAHADFYSPGTSTTGEAADMDLALVTGRGPEPLTNLNGLRPYVQDPHVIHFAQRDQEETIYYGSPDICETRIHCISNDEIQREGIPAIFKKAAAHTKKNPADGYWIHFDTDSLSDEVNPAVDYRLPGGLEFQQAEELLRSLMIHYPILGMTVTIFNPTLDTDGTISDAITNSLSRVFEV